MKLELKHLRFTKNNLVTLKRPESLSFTDIPLDKCSLNFNMGEPYLTFKGITFGLDQVVPHIRRQKDLFKEIEHEGVKFIPAEAIEVIKYFAFSTKEKVVLKYLPHGVVEKLLEWQFDVFELEGKIEVIIIPNKNEL